MLERKDGRGQFFHGGFDRVDGEDGSIDMIHCKLIEGGLQVSLRRFRAGRVITDRESLVLFKAGDNPNVVRASTVEALRARRGI